MQRETALLDVVLDFETRRPMGGSNGAPEILSFQLQVRVEVSAFL